MAYIPTGITSIVNTVPSSVIVGASVFGQLPAGTAPIGSVAILQGTNPLVITGSVQGVVTGNSSVEVLNFPTNQNISGSVASFPRGTIITSLVSTIPSSVIVGASVFGNVGISGTPNVNAAGSVVAFQGTTPWIVGSVYGNISGSVAAQQIGTRITSVVGSIPSSLLTGIYAHRNDAVASFLGGNLTWNPLATDSAGRVLTKPFAADDSATFRYVSSVVSGSVTLIKASAVGLRNYITDFWFVNSGSVATLVTFQDGSTSVVGYAVAPSGTGANSPGISVPLRTAPSQDLAFNQSPSTSILYVTVSGYQAP